jgi:hypothetical protein
LENIKVTVSGNKLLLEVDLTYEGPYTNRGRTRRIASSHGNITIWADGEPLPDGVRFNLNVYRSLRPDEKAEVEKNRGNPW